MRASGTVRATTATAVSRTRSFLEAQPARSGYGAGARILRRHVLGHRSRCRCRCRAGRLLRCWCWCRFRFGAWLRFRFCLRLGPLRKRVRRRGSLGGPARLRLPRTPALRLVGEDPLPVQRHQLVGGGAADPREAFDGGVLVRDRVTVAVPVHRRGAHVQLLGERSVTEPGPPLQLPELRRELLDLCAHLDRFPFCPFPERVPGT